MTSRPARFAGSWYPSDPDALAATIDAALASAAGPVAGLLGGVGPHAGVRYSGAVAGALWGRVPSATRRIWLIGPSHRVPIAGVALPHPSLTAWQTPLGDVAIDQAACDALRGQPGFDGPAAAHAPEHSLEMHVIFMARAAPSASLVPLLVGSLGDAAALAAIAGRLRPLVQPGDLVIASTDFTHYGAAFGYVPFTDAVPAALEGLRDAAVAAIVARDRPAFEAHLRRTRDTICGREAVRLVLELLPQAAGGEVVAADTSGAMTGDWSHSVSYASVAFSSRQQAAEGPPS